MKHVFLYYETLPVSERYFIRSLKPIRDMFNIKKIELKPIHKIEDCSLSAHSSYPRILLTHNQIVSECNPMLKLDGIGILLYNIAIVKFQNTPFTDTMFLLAHEYGHLMDIPHCSSPECIMGISVKEKDVSYAWHKLSKKRKLSKRLLCPNCKTFL